MSIFKIFSTSIFSSSLLALFVAVTPTTSYAIPVSFDIYLTMIETNENVGTGVTAGDTYTGVLVFDSADLAVDGTRQRSIVHGGDSITIAGLAFDDYSFQFMNFTFLDGAPICLGDFHEDGCGTSTDFEGQSLPLPNGDDLIFYDNYLGKVRDSIDDLPLGPYEFATFEYSFTRSLAVAEPGMLFLIAAGILGLIGFGRGIKPQLTLKT